MRSSTTYQKQATLGLLGLACIASPVLVKLPSQFQAFQAKTAIENNEAIERSRIEQRRETADSLAQAGVLPNGQKLKIRRYVNNPMDFVKDEKEPNQTSAMQHVAQRNAIPALTKKETARLREDYPAIEYLEAGKIGAWLVERQDQLLIRAKTTRAEMNLSKLITLAGTAIGAVCYATSPLAPLGTLIAGVGYVWAVAQDINNSHQFAPVPFVRGNFLEFLSAMGDVEAREEWFSHQHELVDLMNHLEPLERYEFVMLRQYTNTLVEFLSGVDPGKCFYAYRWLLNGYITLKGGFPTVGHFPSAICLLPFLNAIPFLKQLTTGDLSDIC